MQEPKNPPPAKAAAVDLIEILCRGYLIKKVEMDNYTVDLGTISLQKPNVLFFSIDDLNDWTSTPSRFGMVVHTGDRPPALRKNTVTFLSACRLLTVNADAPFTVTLLDVKGAALWRESGQGRRTYTLNTVRKVGVYPVRLDMYHGTLYKPIAIME